MLKCFLESTWEEKENNSHPKTPMAAGGHFGLCHGLQVGCKNPAFQHCQLFQGELALWEKIHLQYLPKWVRHLDPEAESVLQGADLLQYQAPVYFCRHFFWNRNVGRIPSFHQKKGSKFPPQIKKQEQYPPKPVSHTTKPFATFVIFENFRATKRPGCDKAHVAVEWLWSSCGWGP